MLKVQLNNKVAGRTKLDKTQGTIGVLYTVLTLERLILI